MRVRPFCELGRCDLFELAAIEQELARTQRAVIPADGQLTQECDNSLTRFRHF